MRRLGAVVVDHGLLTESELRDAVRRQAEEIFFSALLLDRGTFYFVSHAEDSALPARLNLDTQALLLEGLRRADELTTFRQWIPSSDVILEPREPPTSALDPASANLHRAVDGQRTVAELAHLTLLGEFLTTKAASELVRTGILAARRPVQPTPTPRAREIPAEAMLAVVDAHNAALTRLFAAAARAGKAAELRQRVQAFLGASPRYSELFRDVVVPEEGVLPRRRLLLNIDGLPGTERLDLVSRGLHDVVVFAIDSTTGAITPEEAAAVRQMLRAAQ